jgi:malate dehydrogenase (oxaloacetate-decarboxylating)
MPVMEGKAILFKEFGGVDAFPICLKTQDPEEIISIVKNLAPSFGGINLEDIAAPNCFKIEKALIEALDIPVFHDDQHGTAIVTLAGLINALKVVGKKLEDCKITICGAGAAGIAITHLLIHYGANPGKFQLVDSKGVIHRGRKNLNSAKQALADITNTACHISGDHPDCCTGSLEEAIRGSDVFIGVSRPKQLTAEMVRTMNPGAIVFAMANPEPEIMPEDAKAGGAAIIATGRSDFPNQINNVLAFPGVFRGVLDAKIRKITNGVKVAAAEAIAQCVPVPTADKIVPSPLNHEVAQKVAEAIRKLMKS